MFGRFFRYAIFVFGATMSFCTDATAVRRTGIAVGYAAGAPIGLAFRGSGSTGTTAPITAAALARFEAAKVLTLRPEVTAIVPFGAGANLLIDLVRTEDFRLHILDPGIFWNAFRPVSVSRVHRDVDITFGAGAEIALTERTTLGFDWRAFMPEPMRVIGRYGDYARPILSEVLHGGQSWAGLTYSFSL